MQNVLQVGIGALAAKAETEGFNVILKVVRVGTPLVFFEQVASVGVYSAPFRFGNLKGVTGSP